MSEEESKSGIDQAVGAFRLALESDNDVVLCVRYKSKEATMILTELDDAETTKMLRKFAKRAEKRERGE